ncbi:GFA family protein [Lysobacter enzymogenes]|uniref:Aldehyde-activating protein n=1 Tax=Lysobacter enzymogenes TaxID=69 RepID=A0A3N2RN41_LYSEN|nr:GFA family protein [Lysobacter enzymogenes]ROU08873.1 aldehyde-activating protein [Lysobacter enzymogenes]
MTRRTASCACGQLSLDCEGEPLRISICHCLACKRRTGSAFGYQVRYPEAAVAIRGRFGDYAQAGDSGNVARFGFCPQCGSSVFWRPDALPGIVLVAAGAFADPAFPPPPTVSVYGQRRHAWVALPPGCEALD